MLVGPTLNLFLCSPLVLSFPRILLSFFLSPICSYSFDSSLQKSAILLSFPWRSLAKYLICLQSRASQCDQNQWGHLDIYTLPHYSWLYQSVSILIFIDELYATASLLNSEPLRAGMTVIHITVFCLITQGHPPI